MEAGRNSFKSSLFLPISITIDIINSMLDNHRNKQSFVIDRHVIINYENNFGGIFDGRLQRIMAKTWHGPGEA